MMTANRTSLYLSNEKLLLQRKNHGQANEIANKIRNTKNVNRTEMNYMRLLDCYMISPSCINPIKNTQGPIHSNKCFILTRRELVMLVVPYDIKR